MKTALLLSTLVMIATTAIASLHLFYYSSYTVSALLTAAAFLSICFWINKVKELMDTKEKETLSL
ncbi:MAG: hypothetical protein P0Y53_04715 [Candidatus Pseudobacter hemicellulosilyticus]|uniref:Uncharacterized protein n=1 Tax=Candidatus Pseudobacter hemicellulosilyticus TaxID=3121375 RepID=A0AAJ5WTJ2_9BACT|nr:MAG: hypothetical protein P0Y53_04715 [Pseudobacter sp.]